MKPQKRSLPKNRIVPERKIYFRPEVTHCPDCGTKAFNQERCRWAKRLDETTKRRRFRRDPVAYLKQIENKLC